MTQTKSVTNSTIGSTIRNSWSDNNLKVDIVVCHHKGNFIQTFCDSLQKSVGINWNCIIVTSDKNLSISDCTTIHSEVMPAQKRNIGVSKCKSDYVAFFDDDVELDPYCLYELYKTCSDKGGMVYGKLYKADERTRLDEAGGFLTWNGFIWSRAEQNIIDRGQYAYTETIFSGKSASCIIRRDTFKRVGGFDESFGILGEESDLAWRVWLYGEEVHFEPKAIAYHYFNTKFKPPSKYYTSDRVHFNGCRNYITMLLKNLGKEHLWIAYLNALTWSFVGFVMLITGRRKQGWNILRGIRYIMTNWQSIMKKRRIVQTERTVSDGILFNDIMRQPKLSYYLQRFYRYIVGGLHG